jgi:hypothetical protein
MWDLKKKRLSTATVAYPPAPPLITECTVETCTATGEDPGFWYHHPAMMLPDAAFRLHGPPDSVDLVTLKKPQNQVFAFRPCYVEPPNLPGNFYELNNIKCPSVSGYVGDDGIFNFEDAPEYPLKWAGATGEDGETDPLCLWSTIYQWETNPPSLYIGYDDPCWLHYPPGDVNDQYADLYFYIAGEFAAEVVASAASFGNMPTLGGDAEADPVGPLNIRIDMEKGKRLDPKLMPDNVGTQGKAGTSVVMGVGAMGAAFGDPRAMIKDLQDTVAGGQTNAPLNANMRLFASKFGWINMGFLNPPPTWLVDLTIPDDARTPRRRLRALAETATNGTDEDDTFEPEEGGNPAGDLPDPNESGNAGFLRKSGMSADEFFVGTMLAVLLVPLAIVVAQQPIVDAYTKVKNSFRGQVLEKRSQVMKYEEFQDLDPAFDGVLETMPEYQVPQKYSRSSVLLGILTLQTAGVCQCSLMAIFEAQAATTTRIAAVIAMLCFPVFFIFYTYVTLRAVMQPDASFPEWIPKIGGLLYWDLAQGTFKSIPPDMQPGDVMFVPSIPPELLEKPVPVKPFIPPGTSPEDAKKIAEEAALKFKESLKERVAAIKGLGPDVLTLQGKWVTNTDSAEGFMAVYGQQMAGYTQTGFLLITFEMVKKLLMLTCLAGLSTTPDLGPLQIKLLTVLGFVELVVTVVAKPFTKITVNYTLPAAMTTKTLQMVAPILLGLNMVEDQVRSARMHTRHCVSIDT